MRKLLKYMKPYTLIIAAIVAVLVIQAYTDLSLPSYTSNIVNVGIQQGGVDTYIPRQIAVDDMEKLFLFIPAEKQAVVKEAYKEDKSKYDKVAYILKANILKDEEKVKELKDILSKPMLLVTGFDSDSEEMKKVKEDLLSSIPQEMRTSETTVYTVLEQIPEEQRIEMIGGMDDKLDEMPETMLEQAATLYIKDGYSRLGINTDNLQRNYIITTGAKMILLAFLGMIASVMVGMLASRVAASIGRDMRSGVFKKVVSFSNGEFDKFSTASLITRSTNDIQQVQTVMVLLLRMVLYAPILGIGGVFKVFQTNVSMAWIIGLAILLIVGVVLVLFTLVMPKFKVLQNLVDKLNLVTREILTGLSVIRAFSTEKYEIDRFDEANKELTKTNLFVNRAMTFMMPTMMFIMNGITVLIIWSGAKGIDQGQMQVGDMMAFIQYTMQIIMAFLMLCMISIMLPRAIVSANRIDEVLVSRASIRDIKQPKKFSEGGKGELKFDHVSFAYPGAKENVIEDISFVAEPGKTTAIVGSTGSGKSTLVNLIPRFYDVTEGSISVDGEDIRDVAQHDLRKKIGYVSQKGILFSGTIASNITYGNEKATEEEMELAASIAQATDFIEEKSEKYESPISQGGSNVSGGQKQRLAIARAIAKRPDIYIFDDSFSALDYKTDVVLRKALSNETKESTVLIVAQRVSTILNAEQIVVLDEGGVAGIGTHKELLNNCEAYYQIASSQLSEAELAKDMDVKREEANHE